VRVTVSRRTDRDGVYTVRWREGGRRRRRDFPTKGVAEQFAKAMERQLALGPFAVPDAGELTLGEFVEEYWASYALPNLAPRTRDSYRGAWDRHLRRRLGHLPLAAITPAVVEDTAAQLKTAGVGDPTVIKALGFLQGVMRRAIVRGYITSNPVREIDKPPQRGVRRQHPLAPETIERIRAATWEEPTKRGTVTKSLQPFDRMLVTLMAYVGLRPEEARVSRIEHVTGSRLYVPATEHWPHDRDVDLLPVVQAEIREWLMVAGLRSGPILPRPHRDEWTEADWRNWRRRVYQPAARAAGVQGDMRPYRLRGSYASLLLFEGRSPTYVAAQLGHDLATLSKYYAGVITELEGTGRRAPADETIRAARAAAAADLRTRTLGSRGGPTR
jgi:site-specific recombinase XerC